MPIVKVADRATLNANAAGTTFDFVLTDLTVGNVIVIRCAVDNSGTNGVATTFTWTNQVGTPVDIAGRSNISGGLVDPGAANAGTSTAGIVATITATSGTVRLTTGNSSVVAAVAEEWSGVHRIVHTGGVVHGSQAASANLASATEAQVLLGNVVYGYTAIEGPSSDTYTNDSDTTNGSWVALTKVGTSNGTADANQTCAAGYKSVTATAAQTYNPTNSVARDSATTIFELNSIDWNLSWKGDGLSPVNPMTTSTAGTGDHPFHAVTQTPEVVASGSRSPRIQISNTVAELVTWTIFPTAYTEMAVRFYFTINSSIPSASFTLFDFRSGNGAATVLRVDVTGTVGTAGQISLRNSTAQVANSGAGVVVANTEYRCEVVRNSAASATVNVYLGDTMTLIATATGTVESAGISGIRFGSLFSTPVDFFIDDIVFAARNTQIGAVSPSNARMGHLPHRQQLFRSVR